MNIEINETYRKAVKHDTYLGFNEIVIHSIYPFRTVTHHTYERAQSNKFSAWIKRMFKRELDAYGDINWWSEQSFWKRLKTLRWCFYLPRKKIITVQEYTMIATIDGEKDINNVFFDDFMESVMDGEYKIVQQSRKKAA